MPESQGLQVRLGPRHLEPGLCAHESEQVSAKQGGFTQTYLLQGQGWRGLGSPALPGTGTDTDVLLG